MGEGWLHKRIFSIYSKRIELHNYIKVYQLTSIDILQKYIRTKITIIYIG